jgi:hypothetical protein
MIPAFGEGRRLYREETKERRESRDSISEHPFVNYSAVLVPFQREVCEKILFFHKFPWLFSMNQAFMMTFSAYSITDSRFD